MFEIFIPGREGFPPAGVLAPRLESPDPGGYGYAVRFFYGAPRTRKRESRSPTPGGMPTIIFPGCNKFANSCNPLATRLQPVFVLIACKTGRFRFPGGVFRGGFRLSLFKLGLFVEHLQHVPQSLVLSRFATRFLPFRAALC